MQARRPATSRKPQKIQLFAWQSPREAPKRRASINRCNGRSRTQFRLAGLCFPRLSAMSLAFSLSPNFGLRPRKAASVDGGFRYVAGGVNLVRREPRFFNNNGSAGGFPMLWTRRAALTGCGGALAGLAAWPALAEAAYPNRTIKMIVPYSAGGTIDLLGRLVADQLRTGLNATIVVENKPGAPTVLGAEPVARAEADRYTPLPATSSTRAIHTA